MRLVTAFLLAAVPTYAAAQSTPPAAPSGSSPPAKPAATKPVAGKPSPAKPASQTPTPQKPAASKPAPQKPTSQKPSAHKPAAVKPAPVKPAPPPAPPVATEPTPATDPRKGSNTGLPLPRFASLKTDDVNFRRGPGPRYPIEWVYKRRDLPVQIEREFDIWRLVTDPDGSKGWVTAGALTGRRTAVVVEAERPLRQSASDTTATVAKVKKGVIVRVRTCDANSDWCQVQVGDYRGYIKRTDIWGILPGEVIQ